MAIEKFKIKSLDGYAIFLSVAETERINKALPFKLAWELADVKETFKKPATRFEEERTKIYKELGTEQENGGFTFEADKTKELEARITELNETEIEVEFSPIAVSKFEAFGGMQFPAGAFEVLRKQVIKFPEPKKPKETKEPKKTEDEVSPDTPE